MTPEQFARRMRQIGREIEPAVGGEVNRAAGLILATVVPATPVDTGRARGNWQVGVGYSVTNEINRLDKTGQTAINQGRAAIAGRPPGMSIYISNNVPYIGRLNEGYSAQAPAGFVEMAVRAAVLHIRNARIIR